MGGVELPMQVSGGSMQALIIVTLIAFSAGLLAGVALAWRYVDQQWRHNPYKFRTIVNGVIAKREAKEVEEV